MLPPSRSLASVRPCLTFEERLTKFFEVMSLRWASVFRAPCSPFVAGSSQESREKALRLIIIKTSCSFVLRDGGESKMQRYVSSNSVD